MGTTAPQELLLVSEVWLSFQYHFVFFKRFGELRGFLSKINTPVQLQSENQKVTIRPGDYLIADLNGVVHVPKHLAQTAIDLMASQVEADERVAEDLKRGRAFSEAAREHRASAKAPSTSKL